MDIAALNSTKVLRWNVLRWMCFCFGSLSAIFSAFNLTVNNFYTLGYLEICFSLYCLYTFIRLGKQALQAWQSIVMCALITLIVVFGTYIATPKNGVFIWSFALPILYYLLLGKYAGVILSASLLSLQSIILFEKSPLLPFTTFNLSLNLSLTYISIWAVSHIFEVSRAHSSKRLKNLALLDPLTGAGNRLSMSHYFEVELQDKSQLFLFLLDLDFFKQVNDKYGHDVGDKVLVEIAALLRVTLAKGYVFRVGGEEFALLSSFKNADDAFAAAEKLRSIVETTNIDIDGKVINLTISIGVTEYKNGQTLLEFVNLADKELYKAKRLGRNKVYG
ncbi:GGDEF domain-containing protein [Pseudoalteromonas fuliginea]|uniref:diguanylate cyclase n=2 Tax=Pseudoalteromonas fuliginea TaxID=1872678 RepID=A0ABD3Y981_9GAMM|nr:MULTISPECIES: GGDEF domain-containing protein [Pseudoalteromonas]ALQ10190.1 diguanylate cyclase [Pseudoalteromonas sp. Bsw20308]KDC51023.1 diguanylate cyclase [Pseudoalteromonas fuliginea]KJZ28408.1 diguanylate cyclase [Pseudoalteromonas fuliginea]MDQ2044272.1 GGDEF domain-containing protein [Pseudoalteromonas sp. 20-92]